MQHNRAVSDRADDSTDAPPEPAAPEPAVETPDPVDVDPADAEPATMPQTPPKRAKGLRLGYRADEVDAFLAELLKAMERESPTMAPYEVADARFKASRVRRRYQLRSVDEYLEQAQRVLKQRHGQDAVAGIEGRLSPARHAPTLWIYLVAVVLVVIMLAFAFTQI